MKAVCKNLSEFSSLFRLSLWGLELSFTSAFLFGLSHISLILLFTGGFQSVGAVLSYCSVADSGCLALGAS